MSKMRRITGISGQLNHNCRTETYDEEESVSPFLCKNKPGKSNKQVNMDIKFINCMRLF